MNKKIMSETSLNEVVKGLECVGTLTVYGRKSIKYHIKRIQRENSNLKKALNEIREYLNTWEVGECDKNTIRECCFESSKMDIIDIIDKVLKEKIKNEKKKATKEELEKLIFEEKLTSKEIAKIYNVSVSTISNWKKNMELR